MIKPNPGVVLPKFICLTMMMTNETKRLVTVLAVVYGVVIISFIELAKRIAERI